MKTCVCCGHDMEKEDALTVVYRCKRCGNLRVTAER